MKTFTRCLETISKDNLQNVSITPSNEHVQKSFSWLKKTPVLKNVFVLTSSYATWRSLLGMFKTWKCCLQNVFITPSNSSSENVQKLSSRLKTTIFKTSYHNFKSYDLQSSSLCLQYLSIEPFPNVFLRPSNYKRFEDVFNWSLKYLG